MIGRPGISKYFIAIIPQPPVYEEVLEWKNFFYEKFNSKAALRSPPHVTLHMPFEWKVSKEDKLIASLKKFSRECHSFEIELRNFGSFPPRVIFIQVRENSMLMDLQKDLTHFCKTELNLFKANRKDQPYHPHLTVAFRDLKKNIFPDAWLEVKEQQFIRQFVCNDFALLKHNGKNWDVKAQFVFDQP